MKLIIFLPIPVFLVLWLIIFWQNVGVGFAASVRNGTFNHPNLIVYFTGNPPPSKGLVINDVEDFLPMIEKISSEFSQIYCMNKNVVIAAATRNKVVCSKNASESLYKKPLKVYLRPCNCKQDGISFLNNVVELADKANDIFPGTVEYLLAPYPYIAKYYANFKKQWSLSEICQRFMDNSTNHVYKMGIVFRLEYCENEMLKIYSTISDLQMAVFFSGVVYKGQNNLSVEESFIKLTKQFELCANSAKTINPKVELAFQTGFADTDIKGKQDYLALVDFWEMVNAWAISTNITVIINEAFDTPDRGTHNGTKGFWKLAQQTKRYSTPVDFIYMDKRLGNLSNVSEVASLAKINLELAQDLDFKHDNFVVAFDSNSISEYRLNHYYHHDDFLPIIRTISNKFSWVGLQQYNPVVIEAVRIHNSMIMQNKNNSWSQPLQLYQMVAFTSANNLNSTFNTAKAANSVFPDTVKYLLFDYSDADKIFSYLTNAGENVTNQTIELSITLPLLDCLRGTSVRTQVSRLLSYVKFIFVVIGTEQEDYDVGVEETVIGLTSAFATCKKKIESVSREESPKFGFFTSWPDTDTNENQNLSNLVDFWGYMNNWAKMTNTTLLMTEAFDEINVGTYGWWRLAFKPQMYHSIADYVYEDKTENQSMIRNGIPYVDNNPSLDGDIAFQAKWKVANSVFSQMNFIVQFYSPTMRKEHIDDSFSEDNIRKILLKMFTRFSSICTRALQEAHLRNNMQHVALEIAKFNMERGLNDEKASLYMTLLVNDEDDATGAFQVALSMANMANSISIGSVEYFVVFNEDDFPNHEKNQLNYFFKAKHWLRNASSAVSYKLGYIYDIIECGHGTNLKKEIIPAIYVLDLIIFNRASNEVDYEIGVYESVRGYTKQFERCKQKVYQLNSSIEVAFQTYWPDTTRYNVNGAKDLVLFWEKMNEWAVSTNTKIFMVEAFDSPYSDTVAISKLGWWRLVSEETQNGSINYIFEEKREVVLGNLVKRNLVEESTHSKTVLISVLTALIFSGLTAFSVFLFVYRRYKNKLAEAQQYILTKKEEEEFLEGVIGLQSSQSADVKLLGELDVAAHFRKYDQDYEVERNSFNFDKDIPLGSGEFGMVWKGMVMKNDLKIEVAVKTLKYSHSSDAVKNLLMEIKVMIHLGKHENIVSIIGAHTEEMRRGKVLLFAELCKKGSLQNYLRELRHQNFTYIQEGETIVNERTNKRERDNLDQIDLYHSIDLQSNSQKKKVSCADESQKNALYQNFLSKWSYEIANGMEFIVSKKVVHADLATRNVLLTGNLTAKISDFGLSRRLYNYTNYVKTQKQPLPWKWMSPESLRRSEFNEKSDVWAFGITLWEIYSLGDTPYPGLPWTPNFASVLEGGLRPQEPEFNANSIYTLMLRCWNNDPKNRPTFFQLKEILNRLSL